MNRISRAMKAIGMVVLIGLISWAVVVASNQSNQGEPSLLPTVIRSPFPTRPAYCVPLPREAQMIGTPAPTPNRFSTSIPYFRPTVTPIPFAHTYDLSPELPLSEKSEIVIFRCIGAFDLYLVGPNVDIDQALEIEDGDIILGSSPPASLMGHEPPEPTGSLPTQIPPASTPTSFPYPPPSSWFAAVQTLSGDDPPEPLLDAMVEAQSTAYLLIAGGSNDLEVAFNELFAETVGERAALWVAPGAAHTGAFSRYGDEYEKRVVAFFDAALLEEPAASR
jgi:hypothetical protein